MFQLEKLLGNKNSKKINVKSSFDIHYLKTIVLAISFIFMSYQLYNINTEVDVLKERYDNNISQISKLDSDIKSNKKKLKEFNEKIISLNKTFVKDKEDFGLYKLMEHLDKDVKLFDFKYNTNQKQTNLTKEYFSYDFKFDIPYNSYSAMNKIINTIEGTYHNTFTSAKFDKGKFTLTYKFYGKKGKSNADTNKKNKFNKVN